jgi:hypothetical protein
MKGAQVLALPKAFSFDHPDRGGSGPSLYRVLLVVTSVVFVGCEPETGIDYGMNSANVADHLRFDENYPFVGFWKLNPSDNAGLVINKSTDGTYTVWACTPRGSTETWLSPTTVLEDENFNVIDENTIEVADKNGGFQTYVRFQ